MENKVQLITYVDRLGGGGVNKLHGLLNGPLRGLFGGIHILPFFYPSNKADAGFDPIDHLAVDPRLGNWEDVRNLSKDINIITDLIVNHISADSAEFQSFLKKGEQSEYAGMFLTMDKVFPNGASEEQLMKIYLPRPDIPFTVKTLDDGTKRVIWTTFTSNQIDIDTSDQKGREYLHSIIRRFYQNGVKMIRLDAAGYAVKKENTSCFIIPETMELLHDLSVEANSLNMKVLVEVHTYYKIQIEISKKVNYIYDFALSVLILHAIYTGNSHFLKSWLRISPRNSITVLDTHDGISIASVSSDPYNIESKGLIPPEEIKTLVKTIHKKSKGSSLKSSGDAVWNMDVHQVNCTFYEALGCDDNDYLLARLIQFFSPGIPQVYYVGLLAGKNDMRLLRETNSGRDINRHFYSAEEILDDIERPIVKDLFKLIKFRNSHPSFSGGFKILATNNNSLHLAWESNKDWSSLYVDFNDRSFSISGSNFEYCNDLSFESAVKIINS